MSGPAHIESEPPLEEIIERFKPLYTGVVYDTLDEIGLPNQALASDIAPLRQDMQVAGPAFTFQGISDVIADEELRTKRIRMFNEMRYPCVEVRDCALDTRVAHYGEMTAVLGRSKGVVGAVIDGGIRDSGHLLRMGMPVFSRYRCPVEAKGRWSYHRWQLPVQLRGSLTMQVVVNPGDFVFGDIDGVLIIPRERLFEVLRVSEESASVEDRARAEFSTPGADAEEVYRRYGKL
jgi:4-hydroxy-4-methyl-2-oxoglutarate aldolase